MLDAVLCCWLAVITSIEMLISPGWETHFRFLNRDSQSGLKLMPLVPVVETGAKKSATPEKKNWQAQPTSTVCRNQTQDLLPRI
jgi:hypothetical protein